VDRHAAARPRLVVVGNGMAGMRTVEELLKRRPDRYDITVFGAEKQVNYDRILLSAVLAGEKELDEIVIHPRRWYDENGITLVADDRVVDIDRQSRTVTSASGRVAGYDRLLLATGSQPLLPEIAGTGLAGVCTFRDVADVDTMIRAAREHRRAIVIGGGLLGLEAANGLRKRGMAVTVVHLMDSLMERQLDQAAAALLRRELEQRGIDIRAGSEPAAILGSERALGVRLTDGCELPGDLMVIAVGIRPNVDLARLAGLEIDRGIAVGDDLRSSDPAIFAVGECVEHRGKTYGLVAPLWEMAKICADHLAAESGSPAAYAGSVPATRLKVTGIDVFSAGDFRGDASTEDIVFRDASRRIYKRLVLRDDRLTGVVLYGDSRDAGWYVQLLRDGAELGELRDLMIFGQDYAAPAASIAVAAPIPLSPRTGEARGRRLAVARRGPGPRPARKRASRANALS
jgi:nitrite reductase (NADH) large subunit